MCSHVFYLKDCITLIASGTGYIEFFLPTQAEENSQREQTIEKIASILRERASPSSMEVLSAYYVISTKKYFLPNSLLFQSHAATNI